MYVTCHVCMYVCIYVYMYVCIYVCMYICMYACVNPHTHTKRVESLLQGPRNRTRDIKNRPRQLEAALGLPGFMLKQEWNMY